MNVNGLGAAGYPAAGKAKVRQAQDGTQSFDREFMGMASQTPPSFVGKVWTKEELMQSVDKQMQSNQSKKMSVSDMIKATCIEGTRARFRFAGEDKIYTFDEYIKELDKRSKNNAQVDSHGKKNNKEQMIKGNQAGIFHVWFPY